MPDLVLRPYQREAITAAYRAWNRGERSQIIAAGTGSGKSTFSLSMVATALEKGHRIIWLAHRRVLLDQTLAKLEAFWPDLAARAGIVQAQRDAWYSDFVIASIDTVRNNKRLDDVLAPGPFRVVVVDEVHRAMSPTYLRVLKRLDEAGRDRFRDLPGADSTLFLGLSATPERADGKALGEHWRVCYTYPLSRGIAEGALVPPRFVVERLELDLSKVAMRAGDWSDADLEDALMQANVVDHTVAMMDKHARGLKTIVFCVLVKHAEATAAALNTAGFRAAVVSDKTSDAESDRLLGMFNTGKIDVLCNCTKLTEGYDESGIQCVCFARPTKSKPLYVQAVGRGLRRHPSKTECLILDLVGASEEHDLLTSAALLEHGADEQGTRACEACGSNRTAYRPRNDGEKGNALTCLDCGHQAEPSEVERSTWSTFFERRERSSFAWSPVPDVKPGAWTLNAGEEGTVALVDCGDGLFLALVFRKAVRDDDGKIVERARIDYPAGDKPIDRETATACAEDFCRQAEAAAERSSLARKNKSWRRKPASRGQLRLLQQLNITDTPKNSGQAEQWITSKLAQSRLVELGFCERVRRTA